MSSNETSSTSIQNDELEKLHAFFDATHDVILQISSEGIIINSTDSIKNILEFEPAHLKGVPFYELLEPAAHPLFSATINKLNKEKKGERTTFRCLKKGKTPITISWSFAWDANGCINCLGQYFGENKSLYRSLKACEEQLERIERVGKLGSWYMDYSFNNAIHTSNGLFELYGLDRKKYPEISTELFYSLVHPDDRDLVREAGMKQRMGECVSFEHRLIRPDGKLIYLFHRGEVITGSSGQPVKVLAVTQDITERKEAELRLKNNENKYRTLVQNGYDMFYILNTEGVCHFISDSITRVLGYAPDELIGTNLFNYLHPDDVEKTFMSFKTLETEPFVENCDPFRFRNKNNEWRWIEAKGTDMTHIPCIAGYVINSRDITERIVLQQQLEKSQKNTEKKIIRATLQAQENERAQIGKELHDNVNQVLTTVKLYNELCLAHPENAGAFLEKSITQLNNCINEIRSISKRLSAPSLGKILLVDSIRELFESIKITNVIQVQFTASNAEKLVVPPEIHLSIYRIVQEHLTNILKHAKASLIEAALTVNDHLITISVKDNGVGFLLKSNRKGIGISNMMNRAESVNGCLDIISAPGKGCTLHLSVPIKK